MADEKIIKYYLLCTTRNGSKRHILTDINPDVRSIIINKKDVLTYFKTRDGDLIANETIVGGDDQPPTTDNSEVSIYKSTVGIEHANNKLSNKKIIVLC